MRISDWSSDVCSSDLLVPAVDVDDQIAKARQFEICNRAAANNCLFLILRKIGGNDDVVVDSHRHRIAASTLGCIPDDLGAIGDTLGRYERVQQHPIAMFTGELQRFRTDSSERSEEHTSELQSL